MKNRYDLETPDLMPDLEWMLSSGQVSNSLLLEKLLQEYYPKVYQVTFSLLDDRELAERCAQDIFVSALLGAHRFSSGKGVDLWLYQIAWHRYQKHSRVRKVRLAMDAAFASTSQKDSSGETTIPAISLDASLWQAVAGLGSYPRRVLILHVLHAWSLETIANVTRVEQIGVQAALDKAKRIVTNIWLQAGKDEKDLNEALLRLFSTRWPRPNPGEINLTELAEAIGSQVGSRQRRAKPYAAILEVSLLAIVVLIAGAFLFWTGQGDSATTEPGAVSSGSVLPMQEAVAIASPTPIPTYHYRYKDEPRLRSHNRTIIPIPTYTPTPGGVFYGSQKGEGLSQIADTLGVSLEDLRVMNRIPDDLQFSDGRFLYIPGSLPSLTPRRTTPVPSPTYTLPLEAPADPGAIERLIFPESPTYHTVWLDALLIMDPPRPFSDQEQQLRIQLWLSEDQALLLGGPVGEEPYDILLWANGDNYVSSPAESPWFRQAGDTPGEALIDTRLVYGAILFLKDSYLYGYRKYQYIGEETTAGRSSWVITELDEQMASRAVFNLDQQTGFILKYVRNQDNAYQQWSRATMPRQGIINAIEFNVNFPQDLFNPRLPWRGGYALDHTGRPAPLADADGFLPP